MSTIGGLSSSTSGNIYGSQRKGVGGLVSGLDTDELIKGMTTGTRMKISKQLQNKQILNWKTDSYRSISSKLIDFSKKYTSYTSGTNLFSDSFFDKNLVTAVGENSKYIDVSGSSDIADNISILGVKNLATDANFVTTKAASIGKLNTGLIETADREISTLADKTISITYGVDNYTLKFKSDVIYTDAVSVSTALNEALKTATKLDGSEFDLSGKITISNVGEKLTLKSNDTNKIRVKGGSPNALKVLGLNDVVNTAPDGTGLITGNDIDSSKLKENVSFNDTVLGKSITFTYNGVSKSIKFPTADELKGQPFDINSMQSHLQKELDSEFGKGRINVSLEDANVTNPDGKIKAGKRLSFITTLPGRDNLGGIIPDSSSVIKIKSGDAGILGKTGILGIPNGTSNRLNLNSPIKESGLENYEKYSGKVDPFVINVNGKEFTSFNENTSIKDIMETINSDKDAKVKISYMETSDKFIVTSTDAGAGGNVNISGNLGNMLFGEAGKDYAVTEGKDAVILVDYDGNGGQNSVEVTRGTNTFNLEGLNVTLNGTFGYKQDGGIDQTSKAITFNAKPNTEKVVDAIKKMTEDYNEIVEIANKELTTKRNRDYPPLTEEQKEGMTEKQIEAWDKKAKEGMLFGDSDLRSLTTDLRFVFSSFSKGGMSFKDIGITTSGNWKDNGKISLDETKLRAAIEEHPDDVKKLFTEAKDSKTETKSGGAMIRLKDITDKYASTEGVTKGVFVSKAGSPSAPISMLNNKLFKQMNTIDEIVKKLKSSLKIEEDRYQRQFTALEQVVAKTNAQSGWLSQQFGN